MLAAGRGRQVVILFQECPKAVLKNKAKFSNATFREFARHGPAIWSPSDVYRNSDGSSLGGVAFHSLVELDATSFVKSPFCPKGPILASFWTQDSGEMPKRGRASMLPAQDRTLDQATRQDSQHLHRVFAPHLGVALAFEKAN